MTMITNSSSVPDAGDFFSQRADFGIFGQRVVAEIDLRVLPSQGAGGDRHAALKLVIVVGVEQVVFAVVLVVQHNLQGFQARLEGFWRGRAFAGIL
jgi:hypothetical protein